MRSIFPVIASLVMLLWAVPRAWSSGERPDRVLLTFDAPSQQLTLSGDARLGTGLVGRGLMLSGNGYARLELERPLCSAGGTLMLWVRPAWDAGDVSSHTLLSFGWQDGRGGYAVLSQGFHERKRGRKLTFVLNQNDLLCLSERQLEPGRWQHLTAVWSGGRWGFCKLFVDGVKIAQRIKPLKIGFSSNSTLYLGTDRGTSNRRNREARACIDQVRILDRALTEDAVKAAYQKACREAGVVAVVCKDWVAEVLERHGRARTDPLAVPDGEARILLDPDIRWARSRKDTDEVIRETLEGGFNVLVAPVWQGRGTRYPSRLAPADPRLTERLGRNEDPLAYLIERAHAEGLEFHAWFSVAMRRLDFLDAYHGPGTPEGAFNLHLPEYRDFIVALVIEVLETYEVDGVNLDHIRTMGFCTSDACVKDYRQRTGLSLQEDMALRHLSRASQRRLGDWNATVVTDIVERVSRAVRRLRPGIPVSVDAHPLHADLLLQGQDSVRWANEGLIDSIYNMDYQTRPDFDLAVRIRERLRQPRELVMLFSTYEVETNGPAPRDPALIGDYVEITRRLLPGTGMAFYHRKQMPSEQRHYLRNGPFAQAGMPIWPSAPTGITRKGQ